MLSYQHSFHAGNLADVHKHSLLSWILAYLVQKDKPLSYFETHAGRGLYDLSAPEAQKTGEAEAGIGHPDVFAALDPEGPYRSTLAACRAVHGPHAYPGSPWIAAHWLRDFDRITLAEMHPQEAVALKKVLASRARIVEGDGLHMMRASCPPEPRRGLVVIDPSYELKTDYAQMRDWFDMILSRWTVASVFLWYPLLHDGRERAMVKALRRDYDAGLQHEVRFRPARAGHGMIGSGVLMVRPPFGIDAECDRLDRLFSALPRQSIT